MKRYAILLGSAPEDFRQKKIEDMFDFLDSKQKAGDSIVTFANGISEMMLEMVMDNSIRQLTEAVVEPVETTTHSELHSETQNGHSETQSCHSETQSCHSRARAKPSVNIHGNLSLEEDCRVKPDNDTNEKPDNDTNINNGTVKSGKSNSILLYICTLQPVGESEKTFWLGGEEIRREVIGHYQTLAAECGVDLQVVFDSGSELVSEEELGWEEVEDCHFEGFGGAR